MKDSKAEPSGCSIFIPPELGKKRIFSGGLQSLDVDHRHQLAALANPRPKFATVGIVAIDFLGATAFESLPPGSGFLSPK